MHAQIYCECGCLVYVPLRERVVGQDGSLLILQYVPRDGYVYCHACGDLFEINYKHKPDNAIPVITRRLRSESSTSVR